MYIVIASTSKTIFTWRFLITINRRSHTKPLHFILVKQTIIRKNLNFQCLNQVLLHQACTSSNFRKLDMLKLYLICREHLNFSHCCIHFATRNIFEFQMHNFFHSIAFHQKSLQRKPMPIPLTLSTTILATRGGQKQQTWNEDTFSTPWFLLGY